MVASAARWLPAGLGGAPAVSGADEPRPLGDVDPELWRNVPPWPGHQEISTTAAAFLCLAIGTAVVAVAAIIAGGSGSPDFTLGLFLGVGAGAVPYGIYLAIRLGWWVSGDQQARRRRLTEDEWRRIFGPRHAGGRFSSGAFFGSGPRAEETSWQAAQPVNPDPQDEARRAFMLLGVPVGASAREVRIAYHRLAHRYHPDKVARESEELREAAERRMKELNAAYAVLQRHAVAA